jgi:hypothetical protein
VRHSREDIRQGNPRFQPRQCRSEAEVDAVTEREVGIGMTPNTEAMCMFKKSRIAIGGPDEWEYELAGRN